MKKWSIMLGWFPILLIVDHVPYEPVRIGLGIVAACWLFIVTMLGIKVLDNKIKGRK